MTTPSFELLREAAAMVGGRICDRASNVEVARALGYSDSTAFWRTFKTQAGSPPSHFRRPR